jgi:5'-3' exonuclease
MGQDGDWVMLGLATHEPNLVLLREQVIFEQGRRNLVERGGIESYTHNCNFEWLHLSILRDYLSFEFETSNVVPGAPYDLEATIDDFVFMTFFVGNDFLPHMPALDIADEAFDLLFYTYKRQRKGWKNERKKPPYLCHAGNIVSGRRLEQFVTHLGQHEFPYYDNKKREQTEVNAKLRKSDSKAGRESTIPEDRVIEAKEESDRAKYREMLQSIDPAASIVVNERKEFSPVVSKADVVPTFLPSAPEQDVEDGLFSRMASLLHYSVKGGDDDGSSPGTIDDQDLKGRYYYDKFGFTPFDAQKHIALRKAYIEGLVWNLKYYYEGCVSWEWYYPYHYGKMNGMESLLRSNWLTK